MGKPIKLEEFRKENSEKLKSEPTSIKLTPEQAEFIRANNINLSKFVRAMIEDLMKGK